MTERALLVRSATTSCGSFYGVGIDAPVVRVFDTSSGNICAEIDLRAISKSEEQSKAVRASILSDGSQHYDIHTKKATIASTRNVKLSSIHFVSVSSDEKNKIESNAEDVSFSPAATTVCVAGFSNGIICGVRLIDNTLQYYNLVSDTQQDVISITSVTTPTSYIFALCANQTLQVINSATGARVISNIPVPSGTSTIDVASCCGESDNPTNTFEVLLSGITCQVCRIHIPTHPESGRKMSLVTTFAGSSTAAPTHCWIGGPIMPANKNERQDGVEGISGKNRVAMTCAAAEGVIRLWDLHPSVPSNFSGAPRCCRIFSTNHRIMSVSVQVYNGIQSTEAGSNSTGDFGGVICATTMSGNLLLWRFEKNLLPKVIDPFSCAPLLQLSSTCWADGGGRLGKGKVQTMKIICANIPNLTASHYSAASNKKQAINVVRGKYALPHFEAVDVGPLIQKALRGDLFHDTFTADAAESKDSIVAYLKIPVSTGPDHLTSITTDAVESHNGADTNAILTKKGLVRKSGLDDDEDYDDVEDMETEFPLESNAGWASHQADAHRAQNIASEEFPSPSIYHASSVKHLPGVATQGNLVESIPGSKAVSDDVDAFPTTNNGNTLGLAVVPLYQALHVNDKAQVMELITLASRDASDMAATIKRLKIEYLLQLFQILAERLVITQQINHPFHLWIKMILSLRGMEMRHYETKELLIRKKRKEEDLKEEQHEASTMSLPSVFVAPLLSTYMNMVATRDRLAACWGRLSAISAVRPRQTENRRTEATISHGTITADPSIFPNYFTFLYSSDEDADNLVWSYTIWKITVTV
eukprot:Tbor_TRINITY_DN5868_c0_g1::TRINITY_DN5868_c0_g1_i6::g.7127::m.7127